MPSGDNLFLLAFEATSGDLRYATDHQPLVHSWTRDRQRSGPSLSLGRNADMWSTIHEVCASRGPGLMQLVWIPYHQTVEELSCVDRTQLTPACGSECADSLACKMVEIVWSQFVVAPAPHTDERDSTAALVRRRARRALARSIQAYSWTAEREPLHGVPALPKLVRALKRVVPLLGSSRAEDVVPSV